MGLSHARGEKNSFHHIPAGSAYMSLFLNGGESPFLLLAFSGFCFYISILCWFWKPLYRFIYVYLPSLVMVFLTKYTLSLNYSIHKK